MTRGVARFIERAPIPHDPSRSELPRRVMGYCLPVRVSGRLLFAGVDEHTAMRISGHKTREVFRRYNSINDRDLHAAVQRAGEFRSLSTDVAHSPKPEGEKVM